MFMLEVLLSVNNHQVLYSVSVFDCKGLKIKFLPALILQCKRRGWAQKMWIRPSIQWSTSLPDTEMGLQISCTHRIFELPTLFSVRELLMTFSALSDVLLIQFFLICS